jgi:hypothetical protein
VPIPSPTYPKQRVPSKPRFTPFGGSGAAAAAAAEQHRQQVVAHSKATGAARALPPKPGVPVSPPPGTYDPILDSQVRAGARGVSDLAASNELTDQRANTAYNAGVEQTDATSGWSLADVLSAQSRGHEDLAAALSRENQDYATAGSNLQRGYQNLGRAQEGSAAAHGLMGSGVRTGALAAALQARTANQGRDQSALDTTHGRAVADNASALSRLDADTATQSGRIEAQRGWADAGLARDLQYGVDDRSTALGIAHREQGFYGQDANAEKMYQATSSGLYVPPVVKKPAAKKPAAAKTPAAAHAAAVAAARKGKR